MNDENIAHIINKLQGNDKIILKIIDHAEFSNSFVSKIVNVIDDKISLEKIVNSSKNEYVIELCKEKLNDIMLLSELLYSLIKSSANITNITKNKRQSLDENLTLKQQIDNLNYNDLKSFYGQSELINDLVTNISKQRISDKTNISLANLIFNIGDEELLEVLVAMLKSPNFKVRIKAIKAMSEFNNENVHKILIDRLNDSSLSVVIECINIIGEFKITEAVKKLEIIYEEYKKYEDTTYRLKVATKGYYEQSLELQKDYKGMEEYDNNGKESDVFYAVKTALFQLNVPGYNNFIVK